MAFLSAPQLVQSMFGNYANLLGGVGLPANVLSLLNPPQASPAAAIAGSSLTPAATATPAEPVLSPMERATKLGDFFNQNAYGTGDPTKLGVLAAAGFPMFHDPRMIQSYLGTMAMNGDQDAMEQLRRMLQGGWSWGPSGFGYDGGIGGMGGNVGGGQGPQGAHEHGTTSMDAELAAGAAGGGMGGMGAGDINGGMGGLY